ncbi:MAG TPA: DUF3658 domain-containing protein, partial [Acetobacteraceae bacterium]|nr:DUF3658 domain-containing protein [Acetobacteraceae bacterium]
MISAHIVPASRGPWVLQHVLEETKQPGEVLVFPDDLSFGPIAGDIAKTRANVRADSRRSAAKDEARAAFWSQLMQAHVPVIVWFGRHSAEELAMLSALCDRLGHQDVSVIDVTNLSISARWNGASPIVAPPRGLVDIPGSVLRQLAGKQVPLGETMRREYAAHWRSLQAENAQFRVVREDGLRSVPEEEFDSCLMAALSSDWRRTAWVIGAAEDFACRYYRQVGSSGLLTRAAALVEQGTLEAHGSVWDLWEDDECALRLPDTCPRPARKAEILHVASHPSFGGFLVSSLRRSGRDEDV